MDSKIIKEISFNILNKDKVSDFAFKITTEVKKVEHITEIFEENSLVSKINDCRVILLQAEMEKKTYLENHQNSVNLIGKKIDFLSGILEELIKLKQETSK